MASQISTEISTTNAGAVMAGCEVVSKEGLSKIKCKARRNKRRIAAKLAAADKQAAVDVQFGVYYVLPPFDKKEVSDVKFELTRIEAKFPFQSTPHPVIIEFLDPAPVVTVIDVTPDKAKAPVTAKALNPGAPAFIPRVFLATAKVNDLSKSNVEVIDKIPTFSISPVKGSSPTVLQQWDPVTGQSHFVLQTPITVDFIYDTPVCRINSN